MLMSMCYPGLGMKNCEPIQNEYQQLTEVSGTVQLLKIPMYDGTNMAVLEAIRFINRHLAQDLYAALVHGSLATNDEVNYSDFDALMIIKDEVFTDPLRLNYVCKKLSKAQRFLRLQDPLQHHGWMVIGQKTLLHYDQNYLPIETLQRGKSMLGEGEAVLEWQNGDTSDIRTYIQAICHSIANKLHHPRMKQSAYFLKGTLSELMLLPALWYQATHQKGIYKGDSFHKVVPSFSIEEWNAIEMATAIRSRWPKYSSAFVATCNAFNPVLASWWVKQHHWPIPKNILDLMTPLFFTSVGAFLKRCQKEAS